MRIVDYAGAEQSWMTRHDIELGQWTAHLVSRELTGTPELIIDVARFPPGFVHHLHRHPGADQLIVPLDGTIVATGEGVEHRVDRGQLVVLPRDEWHGARNDGPSDITCLVIFTGAGSMAGVGYEEKPA